MIDVIAVILLLYLLYKIVFDFIVPVSKTTSQFKRQVNQMRNMQQEQTHMKQQQQKQSTPSSKKAPSNNPGTTTTTDSEYIDFEDVK